LKTEENQRERRVGLLEGAKKITSTSRKATLKPGGVRDRKCNMIRTERRRIAGEGSNFFKIAR